MCDLYTGYTILPDFRTKVGVRLIHGCDLYTSNYGTIYKSEMCVTLGVCLILFS